MLEKFFTIALNTERLDLVWNEFEKISKYSDKIHGGISEQCISDIFNAFMAIGDTTKEMVTSKF